VSWLRTLVHGKATATTAGRGRELDREMLRGGLPARVEKGSLISSPRTQRKGKVRPGARKGLKASEGQWEDKKRIFAFEKL